MFTEADQRLNISLRLLATTQFITQLKQEPFLNYRLNNTNGLALLHFVWICFTGRDSRSFEETFIDFYKVQQMFYKVLLRIVSMRLPFIIIILEDLSRAGIWAREAHEEGLQGLWWSTVVTLDQISIYSGKVYIFSDFHRHHSRSQPSGSCFIHSYTNYI